MDLAGDIVQSLANYLGLEDLPSTAHFPTDTLKLENLIARYRRKNLIARYTGKRISLTGTYSWDNQEKNPIDDKFRKISLTDTARRISLPGTAKRITFRGTA